MKEQITLSLSALFESMRDRHLTNATILMEQGVGVAEHPDILGTIEEELGRAAEYQDKLEMLSRVKDNIPRI
jgi:hypothetical protein